MLRGRINALHKSQIDCRRPTIPRWQCPRPAAEPAQALLVRLVMRRGPWFRAGKLAYEEIGDIDTAAAPLLALGWLDATAPMTLAELFAVHTHREVATLFAATCTHQATAKSQTKAALLNQGGRIVGSSPAEFAAFIRETHATWGEVVRTTGVKLE